MIKLVCSICGSDLKFVGVTDLGEILFRCSDSNCENGWDDVVESLDYIGAEHIFDVEKNKTVQEIIDE